jgi:hypothetical protein
MCGLQIFVEIERARLTRKLAAIREAEGNINEAADTLQEVAVVGADSQGSQAWSHSLQLALPRQQAGCISAPFLLV